MLSACKRTPVNSRIYGGQDASPGSWPWHVTFTNNGYAFCQGSLITDEFVLTGAQCSQQSYLSGAVVHMGVQNNQSGFGEVTRRIAYIACHQDYSSNYYENDICLVKLSAPVNFTNYIRPVCLASENSTFHDGTPSWVTGFQYEYNYYYSNPLQELNVSVIGNNECTCLYQNSYYYYYYYYYRAVRNNTMCAGQETGSGFLYYGDNGAALVSKQDAIWVQSGIASYVYGYYLSRPSIYTRVSQYEEWIRDRVTGMEAGFVTFTSPGEDSDLNYTCPTQAPTTPYSYFTSYPYYFTTDDSIFSSGETLIPITHLVSLSALVLLLHPFVGGARI
uniref:Serine protease 27 n=1 Tax=Fundulus heteroclitus TaxID=8078 RepID=A0A3Q2QX12_FUNHE